MRILVSFDIDGCLETGDPPGPITLEMVRKAQSSGCIIGSCSDRALSSQKKMWDSHNIKYDFVSPKYALGDIMKQFEVDKYIHTGDRDMDEMFAKKAGFDFYWEKEGAKEPWLALLEESMD